MQISVNGKTCSFEKIVTVQDLLDNLQLTGRLAIEINREIVPRSRYQSHQIHAGDTVEIVRAIGGG